MKICLISEYLLNRSAYKYALKLIDGIDFVIDFQNIEECSQYLVHHSEIEAVLIDVELSEKGINLIKEMKAKNKTIKFVIMAEQNEILSIIALGAAYVLKNMVLDDFVRVIATTLQGNLFIAADAVSYVTSILQEKADKMKNFESYHLTDREKEILILVSKGESNTEIGTQLYLSPYTVKNYVSKIIEKMNVKDRTQATAKAIQYGLV